MTPLIRRLAGLGRRPGRIVLGAGLAALGVGAVIAAARAWPRTGPPGASPGATARPAEPPLLAPAVEAIAPPVALYTEPLPEDFRPEYDGDAANRRAQGWDAYWGWVRTYYRGNFLAGGWAVEARACVDRVGAPAARREVTTLLNDLGRLGSREWSKDRGLRKINTEDVKAWGRRLDQARRDDDGTGTKLVPALRAIRAEAEAKLPPRGGR